MPVTPQTILKRNTDILHAAVGTEEAVMMSIDAGKYYGLNAVGTRIWELLERPQTVAQLCTQICEEFEVDEQTCSTEVMKFTNSLIENGIVDVSAP